MGALLCNTAETRDKTLTAVKVPDAKSCTPLTEDETKLMIKQKFWSFDDEFIVKNKAGKPLFKVCGSWLNITDKIVIRDMEGNFLAMLYGIMMSIREEYIILLKEPRVEGQEPSEVKGPDDETLYDYMKITQWAGRFTQTYSGYVATGKDTYQEADAAGKETPYVFADAPTCASEHLLMKIGNPQDGDKMDAHQGANVAHLDRSWFQFDGATCCTLTIAAGADPLVFLAVTIVHDKCLEKQKRNANNSGSN